MENETKAVGRCADCAHWRKAVFGGGYYEPGVAKGDTAMVCGFVRMGYKLAGRPIGDAGACIVDGGDGEYTVELVTGPDFGCTGYAPKVGGNVG